MKTDSPLIHRYTWPGAIDNLEAKQKIAAEVASQLHDGDVFGAGSGSTSYVAVLALGERARKENLRCMAVPTSHEIALLCVSAGIPVTSLWEHTPDWCFDGADEVDPELNMIKGRGGAMFKEKLVMRAASRSLILIDASKRVPRLGVKFPVPVEIHPSSLPTVERALLTAGASEIVLRLGKSKDGPVITESGNFILDVRFPVIGAGLEKELKSITGVLETGLFQGFKVEILTL
jgi:ribose 5-phosphate isomerase A